ncbi:hypothetical protein D3C74_464620 [compost metagenome]
MFTTSDSSAYTPFCSNSWRGPQRNSSTPSGRPSSTVKNSEPNSMIMVSMVASQISAQSTLAKKLKASINAVPPYEHQPQ